MANWASVDRLGNPASADWQAKNLRWIEPVQGQKWQVYSPAADAFNGFLGDLAATGYPLQSSGGFNYRNIRGGDKLSQHAFGTALDLNAATNPRMNRGDAVKTDLPSNVGELAKKWGLEWGGSWKRPDAMHFEYTGGATASDPQTMMANGNKTVDPVAEVLAAGGNAPGGYTPPAVTGSTGTPETAAVAPSAAADTSKGLLGIDVPGLTGNKNLGGLLAFSQMAMQQPQQPDSTPQGGLLRSQPIEIQTAQQMQPKQTFKPWELSMFRGRA